MPSTTPSDVSTLDCGRTAGVVLAALLALSLLAPATTHAVEFAATPADLTFDTNIPASVDLPQIKNEGGCTHAATIYALSPALPAGLSSSGGSGIVMTISGTPTTVTAQTQYTLSANSLLCTGGPQTVTATFNITVQAGQPTLLPSSVTSTGARLNLVNHTGTYYLKGTGSNSYSYSCAPATAGTAVSLTGLTENRTYIFSAYSASGCSGDALHSLTFTTPGSVSVWIHDVEYNDAVVELGGWSSGSDKWSYDLTSPTDTGTERVSGPLGACAVER